MASRRVSGVSGEASSSQGGWELVLNLFRLLPLNITFPDITRREKREEIVQQVVEFQGDLLRKMHAFQENFLNFHKQLQRVPLRVKGFSGYQERTVRDLRREHPELVRLYYDTLDALIDLYPHSPPVKFILPDHKIVAQIREFEREAHSVYVGPIKTITGSLLFDVYRIWTDDGPVYLPTYLDVHASDLAKSDLTRLKLRMVGPLESKAVFNGNFDPERICGLVNAIQGQMGGHVNRLIGLLQSDGLTQYLKDSLARIRESILPEVMAKVRPDLDGALEMEGRVYNRRSAKEGVCLKDDLMYHAPLILDVDAGRSDELDFSVFADLDAGMAPEGLRQLLLKQDIQLSPDAPITAGWESQQWLLTDLKKRPYILVREGRRLVVLGDSELNRAHRLIARLMKDEEGSLPAAEMVQTAVRMLEEYARRVRELPAGNLVRKHLLIKTELQRSLSLIPQVLDRYFQVHTKAYKAIHPFMGMISITPGGTSDFYVKWFAGLVDFLEFEIPLFKERKRVLQRAIDSEELIYAGRDEVVDKLTPIVTQELAQGVRYTGLIPAREEEEEEGKDEDDDVPDAYAAADLIEMLADYFCLISYVHSLPRELYRIERDLFYNLRKKRTFAIQLIRHGSAGARRRRT